MTSCKLLRCSFAIYFAQAISVNVPHQSVTPFKKIMLESSTVEKL